MQRMNTNEKKARPASIVFVILLALVTIASVVFCIYESDNIFGGQKGNADTKLKIYEGPKTLLTAAEADAKVASEAKNYDLDPEDFKYRKYLAKDTDTKISVCGQELFVYATGVNAGHTWSNDVDTAQNYTPVTYFDFEGEVSVEIDISAVKSIDKIESCTVSPVDRKVTPKVKGKKISFNITEPGDYTVVFNNASTNAIHIFAYDIETNADIPTETTDETLVIGPGEWDCGAISLNDYQNVYISGGAVVHGTISGNFLEGGNLIYGHGILDGSWYPGWKEENGKTGAKVPLNLVSADAVTVRDINILNSNCWNYNAEGSSNCIIDNLHIISARANGDGITIQSSSNMLIKDSFVRSWDDSLVVKNYTDKDSDGITFRNCTVWTDLAQSMEIGYETNKGLKKDPIIKNIAFEDIDVIFNFHKPVMSIHNADDALVTGVTYKDITVEHAYMGQGDGNENRELVDIKIVKNGNWSHSTERGKVDGVTYENIKVLDAKAHADDKDIGILPVSMIGWDETHDIKNIEFKNVETLGTKLTAENAKTGDCKFYFGGYVSGVTIDGKEVAIDE